MNVLKTIASVILWDRCEMPSCSRQGMRGDERVIDDQIMCRDCARIYLTRRAIAIAVIEAGRASR